MKVQVCQWKSCKEKFSEYITTRLENDKEKFDFEKLIIEEAKCMWKCNEWPNVKIDGKIENYIWPAKVSEIVCEKFKK